MIYSTEREPCGIRLPKEVSDAPEEMPEVERLSARVVFAKSKREQQLALGLTRSKLWGMFNWEPEAAEVMLLWIRTGSWSDAGT